MEIALLYRVIFIFVTMGFYFMKLESNWEKKVLHKHMCSRMLRILHRIWFGKKGKEVRLPAHNPC